MLVFVLFARWGGGVVVAVGDVQTPVGPCPCSTDCDRDEILLFLIPASERNFYFTGKATGLLIFLSVGKESTRFVIFFNVCGILAGDADFFSGVTWF